MFKLAVVQIDVSKDLNENLNNTETMIRKASDLAEVIVLPEMFNSPYNAKTFHEYAEVEFGKSSQLLASLSKELDLTIIGGSIPELDGDDMYNTSYTFHKGECIGKHRKVHLFDVDIKGGITFKESSVLTAGNHATVMDLGFIKIGVCICYDMRFPELFRTMIDQGAELIIIPAAFNTITGPAHWHVTARARAIDNQVYIALASPARSDYLPYKAYGHSLIVNPWGDIIVEADIEETIIYADIDSDYIKKIRRELPLLKHRKSECYS